ncbi:MAG: single-stranded DNA-binding protein [Saprospiraceae bacterium]|nr:single-stranded DNA-binding protein [Saprospiraceae bacterium]
MAQNNTVILIGNMGSEARVIKTEGRDFVGFSLATTDSYKDDKGEWQEKETVWHNILAFNPKVVEMLKAFKKGSRLTVTGSLSYRPFEVVNGDGEVITKKEASIIVSKIELTPLVKKKSENTRSETTELDETEND